ncbi:MAG: hypothetical protein CVT64_00200 [Actinobacteria bacterium HGW-Actinobacteria-4]|nr:MAG: hypothetical protein CVT64_00200 [Actinobacteria bacterium HGW-Actinobacteria-4]
MVQKVHVVLEDDLDGGTASETVSFALDGVQYEIDVSDAHAAQLRDAFRPWISAGRKVTSTKSSRSKRGGDVAKIREWARAHGMAVSERGRISAKLRAAYEAAH